MRNLTSHLDSSSPVPVNVSWAPRLSLVLCSGARQQSQRRLGYRQEYWFHYSALTPPTYLTNIHAAFHLLSLQGCCRCKPEKQKEEGRRSCTCVLACLLTHTTPEMLTKTLSHTRTQRAAFTDTCHPSQLSHSVSLLHTLIPPSIFSSHAFSRLY